MDFATEDGQLAGIDRPSRKGWSFRDPFVVGQVNGKALWYDVVYADSDGAPCALD